MYNIFVGCDRMKHASLRKRILAYIIDMFIVSMIISIVSFNYSTSRLDNLNKELNDINNNYLNGELSSNDYINNVAEINYDINKVNVVSNTLYVVVCFGYFVLFQYLNGGMSIGKKLMHIKIVDKNKDKVGLIKIIIRTSIINDILPILLGIIFIYITSGIGYMIILGLINFISFVYVIISIIMIKLRKDRVSLNDIMSGSIVIEEN